MNLYNKIKEFVKGYFPNKEQKEKNKRDVLLSRGFEEGCYVSKEDYGDTEGNRINEIVKESQNIEDMVKDTEIMLNNTRGQ